jgi:F0F1-type ATP synthase assembly protein I
MVEETEKIEILKTIETLVAKIDELTKVVKDEKTLIKEEVANNIDELTNAIKEKKVFTEEKIKENPLAYMIGAFTGGILVGILMGKVKDRK